MGERVSGGQDASRSVHGISCDVPFVDVFRLLGKRWTGMIIVALLQRPARFNELAKVVSGITDGILTERLRELMTAKLVERQLADGPTTAVLYRLTPIGEDLRGAFQELHDWAGRHDLGRLYAADAR